MNALQLLQQKAGVKPDGIFGPATFNAAKLYLDIPSSIAAIHFFAQCGHETGNFKQFEENLNYSAEALLAVFGRYFSGMDQAMQYARKPEKIANRVYGNRMGNGDETSGDGYRFRGRGALQLTGRFNYQQFSAFVNDTEVLTNPDVVSTKYAFESAMHFFNKNGLWEIARLGLHDNVIRQMTRRINGGLNGIDHRIELTRKYESYI
jgi:putative chitinase